MTAAHEKAHMTLMTAAEYGAFVSELGTVIHRLADLQEQNPSNKIAASFKDLSQAMDQLRTACWLTQESGATAIEIPSQLHSQTFDLAAMKQGLPATYLYSLEALERIVTTLHMPFLPGTEPLRSSLCMGICSAALNTGITEHFASTTKISASTILEYLSNPSARPDVRLMNLSEAAQLNPRLLDPVTPSLTKTIRDLSDALAKARARGACFAACFAVWCLKLAERVLTIGRKMASNPLNPMHLATDSNYLTPDLVELVPSQRRKRSRHDMARHNEISLSERCSCQRHTNIIGNKGFSAGYSERYTAWPPA
jgi:hypothetical protein